MDKILEKKKGLALVFSRKALPWWLGALLLIFMLWVALRDNASTLRVNSDTLNIASVEHGEFNDYIRVSGQVQPMTTIQLSPLEGGVVEQIFIEEGSQVRKGDVILRLSNENLDLQILNSEAELAEKENILRNTMISMEQQKLSVQQERLQLEMEVRRYRRAYEQQKALYDEKLIARETYLQAEEDWQLAEDKLNLVRNRELQDSLYRSVEIEQMEESLENMRVNMQMIRRRKDNLDIKAPIDGELGLLDAVLGQSIASGTKIGQINDLSSYKIEAQIDEHYIDRVSAGLDATFERQDDVFGATIRKVYPEVRDGKFKADFKFSGQQPENIRTGQTYYLNLQLGQPEEAVMIPRGSFYQQTGGQWIYVVDKSGDRAVRRDIRIGRQNPQYYEVLEGLKPGEKVIISGYDNFGDKAPGFRQYVPGVEEATRTTGIVDSHDFFDTEGNTISASRDIGLADTSFFRVFARKILAGDPVEIFTVPCQAMVSESFAERLGGTGAAVGKILYNYDFPEIPFTVCGVFEDFPENGSLEYDVLVSMATMPEYSTENWLGNDRYAGYVKLSEGVNPASLKDAIRLMQEKYQPLDEMENQGLTMSYFLTPFDRIHTSEPAVRSSMILLSIVALLLLVISVLNYLLSTISETVRRSREFATRKCFGAEGGNIYGILFREASLVMLVALALAAIMLTAAAPLMENIMGISLSAMMVPLTWIVVTAVVVLVLVSTALVPGWLYMKIPVTAALRSWSDSRRNWKHVLLVTQFTVNVLMFGMLLAIASQYNKVTNGDPGYDYDNVYYVFTSGIPETTIQTCMAELAAVPGIADVQRCSFLPLQFSSGNNIYLPDQNRELLNIADQYYGTSGFFDFFGIPIVEGRAPAAPKEIAVSRSFVSEMARLAGWTDGAVGKQVLLSEHSEGSEDFFTICGVYEDYLIGSFNNPDERPSIRFWAEKPDDFVFLFYLLVKAEDSANGVAANVEDVVRRTLGENGRKVEVISYEEQMRNLYSDNRKSRDIFIMGCIFSLLISIFGLVGYIASEANRRSKEIAIRKINGAKASDITAMFAADTLRMAAVAIIIGDILLYVAASGYLTLFPERVSLSAWNFVAADLLLALLATASAAICSYRISRANPVESIKNE